MEYKNEATESNSDIMTARALDLARQSTAKTQIGRVSQIVEFVVGLQHYGLDASYVQEVQLIQDITPLPGTPAFVAGIINIHGRILPVIDIQHFLGLAPQGITDNHVIIVVSFRDSEICFLADTVVGVRTLLEDSLQPVLLTLRGMHDAFVAGMTAEKLIVLNLPAIIDSPMLLVNQQNEV